MSSFINEIGKTFDRWTVLGQAYVKHRRVYWLCQCSCPSRAIKAISGDSLRAGTSKSCGCLYDETRTKHAYVDRGVPGFNAVVYTYKNNAKRRGLIWTLSCEQCRVLFNQPCFYCGVLGSNMAQRKTSIFQYNGVDRIDSNLGYTVTNVVTCCCVCNRAKSDMPAADYIAWLDRVAAFRNRLS